MDIIPVCGELGIVVQGYCPLAKGRALSNHIVTKISREMNISEAQVKYVMNIIICKLLIKILGFIKMEYSKSCCYHTKSSKERTYKK